jgi:hypothetical protein
MLRNLRIFATATALCALSATAGAQDKKPLTIKQVAKNVQAEAHRAGNRTEDAVRKAGNQTEKQAQRTGKSAARVVSRDARNGDYSKVGGKNEAPRSTNASPRAYEAVAAARARQAEREAMTPKNVADNVQDETRRAGNRTEDAVRKAGNQTEAQAHRTGKSLKKVVSRKARRDG